MSEPASTSLLPKSVQCLRGYSARSLAADVIAGITVGLVALPLAMAFAIASGVPPQSGIYCAIVAGFVVSLLGGSRVQVAECLAERLHASGRRLVLCGMRRQPAELIAQTEFRRQIGDQNLQPNLAAALARTGELLASGTEPARRSA